MKTKMEYYEPNETINVDQEHTLLYTFQFENAFAQLITKMGGNVSGGGLMDTELDCGFTVPTNHDLTQKYVEFYDDEDEGKLYREVGNVVFHYQNGEKTSIGLEECADYLVGIQIINYKPWLHSSITIRNRHKVWRKE